MRGHAWLAPGLIGAMVLVATWMVIAHSAFPADHELHISAFWMTLLGKFLCFAMLALAMDLIWGYTGILSLGQGLFFALGGYLFGMYLMRQIGRDGVYQSDLPDFMVFLDWKALPWYWSLSDSFAATLVLIVVVPGLIAAVFGYLAFRSRIKGVYFSIMTQALTYAAMLAFFRNDMGFGGNNGFTDFKRILGYPIAEPIMPLGRNKVTATNTKPSTNSQSCGNATVNQLLAPLTANAPKIGPIKLPRPPIAAQIAISIACAGDISLGLIIPTCGTYNAPAIALMIAATTQAKSLKCTLR